MNTPEDKQRIYDIIASVRGELQDLYEIADRMIPCVQTPPINPKSATGTVPPEIAASHTLVFEDNFDGPELDPAKWQTRFLWGPEVIINREEQYYTDVLGGGPGLNPFSFEDGNLAITATYEGEGQAGAGQAYYSGIITTRESFTVLPGDYVEVCAKMPCGVDGFWGAIWLLNRVYNTPGPNGQRDPEVDWEFVNGTGGPFGGGPYSTGCITSAYHVNPASPFGCTIDGRGFFCGGNNAVSQQCDGTPISGTPPRGFPYVCDMGDSCDGFHTYGWQLEMDRLVYYMDGVATHSICDESFVPQVDMYLIINQAVGGGFPGPANPEHYPSKMLVDYARIYRR